MKTIEETVANAREDQELCDECGELFVPDGAEPEEMNDNGFDGCTMPDLTLCPACRAQEEE